MTRHFFLERRAARAFGMKEYEKAIDALSDLLDLVGDNPNTLHATAVCQQRLGRHAEALDLAERGIAADPVHLGCLEILTEVHAAEGNLDSAAVFARRALKRIETLSADSSKMQGTGSWWTSMLNPPGSAAGTHVSSPEWVCWASGLIEDHPDVGKP